MCEWNILEFFDHEYKRHSRYWWLGDNRYSLNPQHHLEFHAKLIDIAKNKNLGRVLDIGAGEGSDAIRLAMMGYEVDAIDLSSVATDKINKFIKEKKVKMNLFNEDILNFKISEKYDIIICNGLLHYVEDKQKILQKITDATAENGYNMISLFSNTTPVPDFHKKVAVYPDDEEGIVVNHYSKWKTEYLSFERNKLEKSHPTQEPHQHSFIKMITKKVVIL